MTLQEKNYAMTSLKMEFAYGSVTMSESYHKLETAYNALLESGYTKKDADAVIDKLHALAKREYNAWKECNQFLDSIFDK